jgi:hypothetical protein
MFLMPMAVYFLVIKQAARDLIGNAMTRVWPPAPPIDFP